MSTDSGMMCVCVCVVDGSQLAASQWPTHAARMPPTNYVVLPHGVDDQLGRSDRFSVHSNQENIVRTGTFMRSSLIDILQVQILQLHRTVMAGVWNDGDDYYCSVLC